MKKSSNLCHNLNSPAPWTTAQLSPRMILQAVISLAAVNDRWKMTNHSAVYKTSSARGIH